jgi:hypothetical protein
MRRPLSARVAGAAIERYDPRHMSGEIDEVLRRSVLFRRLTPNDRLRQDGFIVVNRAALETVALS